MKKINSIAHVFLKKLLNERKIFLSLLILISSNSVFSQTIVKGVVKSETGQNLANVSVFISGTKIGTVSDVNGNYSLSIEKNAPSLTFSLVGYATQTIILKSDTEMVVTMIIDASTLGDVVVVGYGTQNRKDMTGAVSTIKPSDYNGQLITNSNDILKGRVAGVSIVENSGAPGGDYKIRIRGANSILGGNDPLVVIDGVQGGLGLQDVNPNDIKSMDILKDASATAIYGSRGANGVILITTKNGTEGPAKVEVNSYLTTSRAKNPYQMMDPVLYAETVNLSTGGAAYSQSEIDELKKSGGYDMYDALLQNGQKQWYELSVRGGSKSTKYSMSAAYEDEKGVLIGTTSKRYKLRTNISTDIASNLTVGMNLFISQYNTHNVSNSYDQLRSALTWGPAERIFNSDGTYNRADIYGASFPNPLMILKEMNVDNVGTNGQLNAFMKWQIAPGLVFNSNIGLNLTYFNSGYSNNELYSLAVGGVTGSGRSSYNSRYWQLSNTLSYTKAISSNQNISVMAGFEPSKTVNDGFNADGTQLGVTSAGYNNLGLNEVKNINSNYSGSSLISYFGRINYSLKDRYLLTASYRADGSSKFTGNNQVSYFPSVGLGWRISEEDFMKNINWISNLKIRGSWGKTGNQGIPPFGTMTLLTQSNYSYGSNTLYPGYTRQGAGNAGLKWEVTSQKDIGLDASFFNSRLNFTFDAFSKLTSDLLQAVVIPLYNGGGFIYDNIGKIENKGLELTINASAVQSKDWKWDVGLNASYIKNKVISVGDEEMIFPGNTYGGTSDRWFVVKPGQPLGTFYGYKWLGVWKTSEATDAAKYGSSPGDNKFEDINKDNLINGLDNQVIGHALPKWRMGFNSTVSYKNFALNTLFESVSGGQNYNYAYSMAAVMTSEGKTVTLADGANYWKPNNDNAEFANILSPTYNAFRNSSQFLQDASFITLRNVSLSYSLSKQKTRLGDIKFFISGQNLFLITKYKGNNPEATATGGSDVDNGLDLGVYPLAKRYTAGLTITF